MKELIMDFRDDVLIENENVQDLRGNQHEIKGQIVESTDAEDLEGFRPCQKIMTKIVILRECGKVGERIMKI